jgi:hypothetical protein
MTLILGMSKAEGIYMSADFRVTETPSGRLVDDASVKMLDVQFAPVEGGTRALIAFTGLAVLPDGTPLGTWLRETMRGEPDVPDQAMAHLRARLDRDVAPLGIGLIVNALLIEGDRGQRRLFGGISNLVRDVQGGAIRPLTRFEYVMNELTAPFLFANGSGAVQATADAYLGVARRQLVARPRRALDHMKLLAALNRRVAAKQTTVSSACHVAFIPAVRPRPGVTYVRFGPQAQTFSRSGEESPAVMPMLFAGIDLSIMAVQMQEQMAALKEGRQPSPTLDVDEMNRLLRRRP